MSDLEFMSQVELEWRNREDRIRLEPVYAWYDESCPCGLPAGDCRIHPRARFGTTPENTEQRPPSWEWQTWMMLAGRGAGKMLDINTPIACQSGWRTMGGLRVGDDVFDESGRSCVVTAVSPIVVPDVAYRLYFSDGTSINACADHQWVTWTHVERKAFLRSPYEDTSRFPREWPSWRLLRQMGNGGLSQAAVEMALCLHAMGRSAREIERRLGTSRQALSRHLKAGCYVPPDDPRVWEDSPGPKIRTTAEIVQTLSYSRRGDTNHCIPNCGPLILPDISLPIPPYSLGLWFGNGSRRSGVITAHQDDQAELRSFLEADGFETTIKSDPQSIGTTGLRGLLYREGLLLSKKIPPQYLRASISQRLALLRGLMDADGGPEHGSAVSFTNTDKDLADGVYELAVSLGMKPTRNERVPVLDGVECARAYRVSFNPTVQVFRLRRKAERTCLETSQALRKHHRMIVRAERIEPTPMRCITVDSVHSTYLAGSQMVPTHNTISAAKFIQHRVEFGGAKYIGIIGATDGDVYKYQLAGPSGLLTIAPPWCRPVHLVNKGILVWPSPWDAVGYLFTSEVPGELRGANVDTIWGDEPAKWKYRAEMFGQIDWVLRNIDPEPMLVLSGTPKPFPELFQLEDEANEDREAMRRGEEPPNGVAITSWSTHRNARHLSFKFLRKIEKLKGTRVYAEEALGKLLRDIPGSLWNESMFLRDSFRPDRVPLGVKLIRIAVGVDPARGGADPDPQKGSETGIVVAGLGSDGRAYVLGDFTIQASPAEWAEVAVWVYWAVGADVMVGEVNNGGDMIEHCIRSVPETVDHKSGKKVNYKVVSAAPGRSKDVRAEPIAAFYERGEVSHVKPVLGGEIWILSPTRPGEPGLVFRVEQTYEALEYQLTHFIPPRPDDDGRVRRIKQRLDRMDALVWVLTELLLGEPPPEDPGAPEFALPREPYGDAVPYDRYVRS